MRGARVLAARPSAVSEAKLQAVVRRIDKNIAIAQHERGFAHKIFCEINYPARSILD